MAVVEIIDDEGDEFFFSLEQVAYAEWDKNKPGDLLVVFGSGREKRFVHPTSDSVVDALRNGINTEKEEEESDAPSGLGG